MPLPSQRFPASRWQSICCTGLQGATGGLVTAFELMHRRSLDLVEKHIPGTANPLPRHDGWMVLIEVSNPTAFDATEAMQQTLAQAMEDGSVVDAAFAKTARDRQALWKLRETLPDAHRLDGATIANDISVQPSRIARISGCDGCRNSQGARERAVVSVRPCRRRQSALCDQGAGRMRRRYSRRVRRSSTWCRKQTAKLGGSISAEHGLGLAKNEDIVALQERGRNRTDARAEAHARSEEHPQSGEAAALDAYCFCTPSSAMLKTSVWFGGMTPPAPCAP